MTRGSGGLSATIGENYVQERLAHKDQKSATHMLKTIVLRNSSMNRFIANLNNL
jgi:hypothetical protein